MPKIKQPSEIATNKIGAYVEVWHYTTICSGTEIGDYATIGGRCFIGRDCKIGEETHIQDGCFLPNGTVIGERVFIGPNVTMTDDRHPRIHGDYTPEPPIIEDEASIGAGAVLLPGVRIGKGAMVGAGAVVTKDVPPGATVIGCPAKEHA